MIGAGPKINLISGDTLINLTITFGLWQISIAKKLVGVETPKIPPLLYTTYPVR